MKIKEGYHVNPMKNMNIHFIVQEKLSVPSKQTYINNFSQNIRTRKPLMKESLKKKRFGTGFTKWKNIIAE